MGTKTKVGIGIAVLAVVAFVLGSQGGLFKGTVGTIGSPPSGDPLMVTKDASLTDPVALNRSTLPVTRVKVGSFAVNTVDAVEVKSISFSFDQSNIRTGRRTNIAKIRIVRNSPTVREIAGPLPIGWDGRVNKFSFAGVNLDAGSRTVFDIFADITASSADFSVSAKIPQNGIETKVISTGGLRIVPFAPLTLQRVNVAVPAPVVFIAAVSPSPSSTIVSGMNQRIGALVISPPSMLTEVAAIKSVKLRVSQTSNLLKNVALRGKEDGSDSMSSDIWHLPNAEPFTFNFSDGAASTGPGAYGLTFYIHADVDTSSCVGPESAAISLLLPSAAVTLRGVTTALSYSSQNSEAVFPTLTATCTGVPPVHPELTVSKNPNMGNENVLTGGTNTKIAAFDIKVGSSEALKITSVGLQLSGTFDAGKMWNYRLLRIEEPGVTRQFGTTVSVLSSDKELLFSSVPSLDLSINSTGTFHLVADLAPDMPVGATIITTIQSGGVQGSGATSESSFQAMGEPVELQTVTIAAPSLRISQAPGSGSPSEVSPGIRGQEVLRLRFTPNADMEVRRLVFSITGSHSPLIERVKLEVPGSGYVIGPSDGVVPDASGKATFTGLTYPVGPGYGNELIVKADILPSASLPFGSTSNPFATFQIGILAGADVEAMVVINGQMVNASGVPVNGPALQIRLPLPTVAAGSLLVSRDPVTNLQPTQIIAGLTGTTSFGAFKFVANDVEDIAITRVKIRNVSSSAAQQALMNLGIYEGTSTTPLVTLGAMASDGRAEFNFASTPVFVPRNSYKVLAVKARTVYSAPNGAVVQFGLDSVSAQGVTSGTSISPLGIAEAIESPITIYPSRLSNFEWTPTLSSYVGTGSHREIGRFKLTAVWPDGNNVGVFTKVKALKLVNLSTYLLSNVSLESVTFPGTVYASGASGTHFDNTTSGGNLSPIMLPDGQTWEFKIFADVAPGASAPNDVIQLRFDGGSPTVPGSATWYVNNRATNSPDTTWTMLPGGLSSVASPIAR